MMNESAIIAALPDVSQSVVTSESVLGDVAHEYMEPWAYNLTTLVLFLIGFFGFFLNLFVIVLMCKDMQMWTPMNIILLNLVCSDFAVSIVGNPFTLVSAWNHKWVFGDFFCEAYGFFMSLLGITSITTLTVLAYERCCLVSCPFSSTHLTNRGAKICVYFIWLYSLILTTPPLFGWGAYVSEAASISCSVNWESQTLNATTYIVFLFVFGLFVPVIVILYSYIKIIKTMRENAFRAGKVNKVESKVTRMIAVMIIAFIAAWTPYSLFALCEQFGDPNVITPALAVIPALVAKSSICYNPCIYVISNSQFRASWRRVFGKKRTQTTTINDTVTNAISETSGRTYIECSFTKFDRNKKKKAKLKALTKATRNECKDTLDELSCKKSTLNVSNEKSSPLLITNDPLLHSSKLQEQESLRNELKKSYFELKMLSKSGKTFTKIIQTSNFKSNLY